MFKKVFTMEQTKVFDVASCKELAEIYLGTSIENIFFGEDFFGIKISYKKRNGSNLYVYTPPEEITTVFDIVFVQRMLKVYAKKEHIKITKYEVINKLLRGTIVFKQ